MWASVADLLFSRAAPALTRKVRAHQTHIQMFAASVEEWGHAIGNQYADYVAKLAAQEAAVGPEVARSILAFESRCR